MTESNSRNAKHDPSGARPASQSNLSLAAPNLGPKSEPLAPGLYLVATPIGNLRDITLRALDVLSGADAVLAEDTRRTKTLLAAYDISASLEAYHDHNAAKKITSILKRLKAGASIALVSDAGTPLVSDPGFKLARDAGAAGIDIIPVPGASALLAGLLTSGLPSDQFSFCGFLPPKTAARKRALEALKSHVGTLVFFESAGRLPATLEDIISVLGDRPAAIARELTKRYEETRRGRLRELLAGLESDAPRGEIVLLIGPSDRAGLWDQDTVDAALIPAIAEMGSKRAAAQIAAQSGWTKRDVYQRALGLK